MTSGATTVGGPMLTTERYLAGVREATSTTFGLAEGRLDAPIPACPDWRMRDLVYHLGNIAFFMRACLDAGAPEPEFTDAPMRADDELAGWAAGEVDAMVTAFAAADPAAPAWNWSVTPHVAFFWPRCLLHEVVIHGWDAAAAVGVTVTVDADIAADGVDEILAVHLPSGVVSWGRRFDLPGPVEVRATDTGHRWRVTTTDSSVRVGEPTGMPPAGVLSGTAAQLYLALWDRDRDLCALDERWPHWVAQLSAGGG